MTTLIVKFPAQKIGQGGGVLARRKARDDKMQMEEQAEEQQDEQEAS
jgi:hypothetical protein